MLLLLLEPSVVQRARGSYQIYLSLYVWLVVYGERSTISYPVESNTDIIVPVKPVLKWRKYCQYILAGRIPKTGPLSIASAGEYPQFQTAIGLKWKKAESAQQCVHNPKYREYSQYMSSIEHKRNTAGASTVLAVHPVL